jgi:hypothetical protein
LFACLHQVQAVPVPFKISTPTGSISSEKLASAILNNLLMLHKKAKHTVAMSDGKKKLKGENRNKLLKKGSHPKASKLKNKNGSN